MDKLLEEMRGRAGLPAVSKRLVENGMDDKYMGDHYDMTTSLSNYISDLHALLIEMKSLPEDDISGINELWKDAKILGSELSDGIYK